MAIRGTTSTAPCECECSGVVKGGHLTLRYELRGTCIDAQMNAIPIASFLDSLFDIARDVVLAYRLHLNGLVFLRHRSGQIDHGQQHKNVRLKRADKNMQTHEDRRNGQRNKAKKDQCNLMTRQHVGV